MYTSCGFQSNLQVLCSLARAVTVDSEVATKSHTMHTLNVMGKGERSEDAENKQHIGCILCGDNFVVRRINPILDA